MNIEYKRLCPLCGKELTYKSNEAWNLAKRRNANCRSCSTRKYAKRIGDASFLLDGTNESFYWIGFIFADGTISNNNRLTITISRKDKCHLEKLAVKLGVECVDTVSILNEKEYKQVRVTLMHTDIFNKLAMLYDIKTDKTHYPPNLTVFSKLNRDQILSLFIGFIDGDGSIGLKHKRNDFNIRIKNHSSWLPFFECFDQKLNIKSSVKINKEGYALMDISNYNTCKEIKLNMIKLGLPYLKRKWNIIDDNYFGKNWNIQKKCLSL